MAFQQQQQQVGVIMNNLYELNNHGVNFLDHGDLPKAFEVFRVCLQQLHSDMRNFPTQAAATTTTTTATIQPLTVSSVMQMMDNNNNNTNYYKPHYSTATTTTYQQQVQQVQGPLHTRGLRVPTGCNYGGVFSQDLQKESTIFSSLVVFNLGLTCHLASIEHKSSIHTIKAKALYKQSHQLLVGSITTSGGSTGNAIVDWLYMALLNNQGQLYSESSDMDISQQFFEQLIRLALDVKSKTPPQMTTAVSSSSSSSDDAAAAGEGEGGWMTQQVDSYLFNAVIVGLCPLSAAAAA